MKRIWLTRALFALLFGIGFISGCSCDDTTSPPTTSTKTRLDFSSTTSARYETHLLDTANTAGQNYDQPVAGSSDTMTETIVSQNDPYMNKTGVVVVQHVYRSGRATDTTHYWQDANDDLYSYNYGLSFLNAFPGLKPYLTSEISSGWVLQAKMRASEGTKWEAFTTTIPLNTPLGALTVKLTDTATMQKDTTISLGSKSYIVKHVRHNIQPASPLSGSELIDTYVSGDLGETVINIIHSGTITALGNVFHARGESTTRISP